jgi:diguanylate cyclase (GGDEF)-like protein/PAS domain S-box-containing protein
MPAAATGPCFMSVLREVDGGLPLHAQRVWISMVALAQLGVAATSARDLFALCVIQPFVLRPLSISWSALAFLVCLSAAAGALMNRLRAKAEIPKPDDEPTVKELTMLRAIAASLPDLIFVKDAQSRFLLANQGTADAMGVATGDDLLGKTDFDFYSKEIAAGYFADEQKVILSGQPLVGQQEPRKDFLGRRCLLTTKVPLRDAAGRTVGTIGIGRDITKLKEVEAELNRARDELAFKAAHDSLTSLLNRDAILEMLGRELARSVRENGRTTVLLGDLDHFKNINDIHGHPIGDEVLQEVARRLMKTVRPYDLVSRFGGEEFLVVLPGCASPDALARANHLREAIAASPIPTADGPIPLTISIGVLVAQEWGQPTSEEVLREVDAALYASKASGRNCCRVAAPPPLRASA